MCDAVSAISLGLVIAGTVATTYGVQQAQKAEATATNTELDRQKKLRDQADQTLAQTIQGNAGKKTAEDAAKQAATREAAYAPVAASTGQYAPPGVERPAGDTVDKVVADAYAQQGQNASDYVRQQGSAQAQMQGLQDAFLNNAILTQNQNYELQKLGSFMQGSASVLPYELNAASHQGDTSKTVGGILSALGAVTGAGAATGAIGGATGVGSVLSGVGSTAAGAYPTLAAAKQAAPNATAFTKTWRGYYPKAQPIT